MTFEEVRQASAYGDEAGCIYFWLYHLMCPVYARVSEHSSEVCRPR